MSVPDHRAIESDISGLGCFTAAIAGYLTGGHRDVTGHLARSVRLAVAPAGDGTTLAFSHHRYSLADLPDGGHLAYAAAPTPDGAGAGIRDELERHGRVIAVGNTAGLPWSPGYHTTHDVHWFLVDDHRPGRWHVVDRFVALLPGGEHLPHDGWLSDDELAVALTPRPDATPVQRNRDRYAFGVAAPTPPPSEYWWIRRSATETPTPDPPPWQEGAPALETLARRLLDEGDISAYVPDVWAASRHRLYRLHWLAATRRGAKAAAAGDAAAAGAGDVTDDVILAEAMEAWRALPMAMRFAEESTRRGRPRLAQLRHTLHTLIRLESEIHPDAAQENRHDR